MVISNEVRIGRFWDYPVEKVNDQTPEEIKAIIRIREMVLDKVNNGQLKEEEYKHFCAVIKKVAIKRFVEFIDVADVFLSLSKEDIYVELLFLLNKGVIQPKADIKSVGEMIIYTILEIQIRLFSISNIALNEEEKYRSIDKTIDERIEFYEQTLLQAQNLESEYVVLLKDLFRTWVNENLKNEILKAAVLNQETKIIKMKGQNLRETLKKLYLIKGKTTDKAERYFTEQAVKQNLKNAIKRK